MTEIDEFLYLKIWPIYYAAENVWEKMYLFTVDSVSVLTSDIFYLLQNIYLFFIFKFEKNFFYSF